MNSGIIRNVILPAAALLLAAVPGVRAQEDPSMPSGATAIAVIRGGETKTTGIVSAPQAGNVQAKGSGASAAVQSERSAADVLKQGEHLVKLLGCNDCHTPFKMGPKGPEKDMTRMLSGHPEDLKMDLPAQMPAYPWTGLSSATNTAFAGPWGVTYAINLTPDPNTGMGIWTEEMFFKAMREGKHMGTSRPIMPPMPWDSYANLDDADMHALFSYLKSIPAISNHVPDYQPPAGSEEKMPE